jgi:hypothetical protein
MGFAELELIDRRSGFFETTTEFRPLPTFFGTGGGKVDV